MARRSPAAQAAEKPDTQEASTPDVQESTPETTPDAPQATDETPDAPQDAPETSDTQDDGYDFEVRETDEKITYHRPEKPNPLLPAFQRSLDTGKTLEINVTGDAHAKAAVNLLRRAAKTLGVGLSVRPYPEQKIVRFRAKAEKIKRSYTAEEVRVWARENGAEEGLLKPRIDKRVRDAFKAAHKDSGDADA